MTSIIRAGIIDAELLTDIGRQTFFESHGHSGPAPDIAAYASEKFNVDFFKEELKNTENIYHFIYHGQQLAGYSKIVLNCPHSNIPLPAVTKLERLYLLKDFYGLALGQELFSYNIQLSKENSQSGMWLFVWKDNQRALNFYLKNGFQVVGSHDFKISETHYNPNHLMLLKY